MMYEWPITIPAITGAEERRAFAYVPDQAYAWPERRYPVLYMFDGQNLFRDGDASYGKSWGLLDYLTEHGVPLIVAAIECSHHAEDEPCGGRLSEYSPFDFTAPDFSDGLILGRGKLTMDYFTQVFKPYIDEHYPTLPDRDHTFLAGSSMGGLMTVYGLLEYGSVFGRGAALSPSFDFCPEGVKAMLRRSRPAGTVLYMDNGAEEMRSRRRKSLYAEMTAALIKKGVLLTGRVVPGGIHSESSWERQLPFLMETLFYDLEESHGNPLL